MRKIAVTMLAMVWFLVGCQAAARRGPADERSPDFLVPAGSRLVVHQPLQVPAWQDQIYFQEGQTMTWRGVNIYLPHCTLKMAGKKESEQTIRADTFVVKQSYTERFFMQVEAPLPPAQIELALVGGTIGARAGFDDREAMDYQVVAAVMELEAADQPEVTKMLCADWGLPQERAHITIQKIRRALGSAVTLELVPNSSERP